MMKAVSVYLYSVYVYVPSSSSYPCFSVADMREQLWYSVSMDDPSVSDGISSSEVSVVCLTTYSIMPGE